MRYFRPRTSQAVKEFAQGSLERLGDAGQGIDRDGFLTALHIADVSGMQLRLFSQSFLAVADALSFGPDVFTQHAAMLQNGRHRGVNLPEAKIITIGYAPNFALAS